MASRMFEIAFNLAGRVSSSFGNMFASASDRMRQLNQRTTSLRTDLRNLERAQRTGTVSTQQYAQSFARITRELQQAERAQQRYAQAVSAQQRVSNFRNQARTNMMDGAAMAVTLGAPVNVAMGYEQSMAEVKAITTATNEDFNKLSDTARELGRATKFSASEAAGGMKFLGMAGFKTNQIIASMPGMLDLAAAGSMDLATSADISSNILSGFSLKAEQMGRVSDVLAKTFTSSNTDLLQLGDAMKYVAPIASAAGVSLEQTAAMVGLLGNVGIQGSQAGTALRASMIRLVKPPKMARAALAELGEGIDEETKDALEAAGAMESLGMKIEDANGNMRPMPVLLKEIALKTKGMGNAQRNAAIAAIFGTEAAAGMIEIIKQSGTGALDEYITQLENADGTAAKMAATMIDTSKGSLTILKSATEDVAISVGNILLPSLTGLAGKAVEVANKVQAFTEKHPELTRVMVMGAAAALGLGIAVTATGYAASLVISPFVNFYAWATRIQLGTKLAAAGTRAWAAAQWLVNAAMSMNPIVLVVASIAGLIAIGVLLYKNFESVRNIVDNLWGKFKETFPGAAQLVETVGQKVGALWGKLKGFWSWLTGGGGGESEANEASSGSGGFRNLERYAAGGIANRPSLFGEAGPEMAIPLDGSSRSQSLWERTGEMIGVSGGGSSESSFVYSPVIHAHGGDPKIIKKVLDESKDDFFARYQTMNHQQRRVAYG